MTSSKTALSIIPSIVVIIIFPLPITTQHNATQETLFLLDGWSSQRRERKKINKENLVVGWEFLIDGQDGPTEKHTHKQTQTPFSAFISSSSSSKSTISRQFIFFAIITPSIDPFLLFP